MFNWVGTVTNTRGDSLSGWQVECVELADGQTVVPIFADENGTPISTVSGVTNRAVSDGEGNYNFFVPSGTYSLRFYDRNGEFQRLQRYLSMYGADAANTENLASAGGSALVGFQQAGMGAVLRDLQAKARETISVKDFGAVGNNSTDNLAAFNAAAAALNTQGGGTLFVPRGRYFFSDRFALPTNAKITIEGEGQSATVLRFASSAAGGVRFVFDDFVTTGGGVRALTIESGAGYECAGFFGEGSAGTGLEVIRANDNFVTEDLGINNFATGQALLGCFNTRHRGIKILFCKDTGLLIDSSTPGISGRVIGASNAYWGYKISNLGFAGDNSASVGYRIRATGGEYMVSLDVTSFNKGFRLDPRTGDAVLYVFGSQLLADACDTNGWEFDGTDGNLWSCHFYDFWSSFNTDHGVVLTGANLQDIQMWGRVRENGKHGILAQTGNWYWRGGTISHNGRLTASLYDGVNIQPGVSDWAVQNSVIGNDGQSLVSQQNNGIKVEVGASNRYIITGNTIEGNTALTLDDGGSGADKVIEGNFPRVIPGLNFSGALYYSSSTAASAPAAGSTAYIGTSVSTLYNPVAWRAPRDGVFSELRIYPEAAPGAGETFTYTLFVNGTATGLTGVVSGDSEFSLVVATPAVSVSAGSSFAIEIVTSSGAAVTNHSGSLKFE